MYCKHCGKQLSDEAIMCPECGAPTGNAPVVEKTTAPKSEPTGKNPIAIIGFTLAAIAVVYGLIVYSIALAAEAYSSNLSVVAFGGLIGLAFCIYGCIKSPKNTVEQQLSIVGIALAGAILFYDFIVSCLLFAQYL